MRDRIIQETINPQPGEVLLWTKPGRQPEIVEFRQWAGTEKFERIAAVRTVDRPLVYVKESELSVKP